MRTHLSQQFEGQDWTRWPQQQPQPTEYHHMMSTPPLMPFDSPPSMTANESKHIVTHSLGPSYMMPNQYQPGPPYEQPGRPAQYHQPMPFAYGQYPNQAPATPMTPPFEPQTRRPDIRLLSPIEAHPNMHTRARPGHYHGILGSPVKSEPYQDTRPDSANNIVDGPRKDVNPIRPDDPTKQIEFNTPIDNLMRRYQSLGSQQHAISSPQLPTPVQSPRYAGVRRLPITGRKHPKTFQCDKCDYVSSQKAHLNAHKRTHTSELPYQCPHCGKRCSQKGNLDVHIRAHKGERVFKCEHPGCDSAGFFSRSNLVAHKKIHMSARNKWVCKLEGCTKSFSSTGNRKAHHNKFHEQEFARLTLLIDEYNKTGQCPEQDKLMVEELALIYKNSNKGIKGRGKGVKVHKVSPAPQPEVQFAAVNWNNNKVPMGMEDRPVNVGSVTQMLGPMYHKPEHAGPMDMMYRSVRDH